MPDDLFLLAQQYLLTNRTLLPGLSVLSRLVNQVSNDAHLKIFENVYQKLPPSILTAIEEVLKLPEGEQRTFFFKLKTYPPSASISTLQSYLKKYHRLIDLGIDQLKEQLVEPVFQDYLYQLAKKYSAKDLKRFDTRKRYTLMICFLLESRKLLLDYLISLHDQYMTDMVRKSRNAYEKQYRKRRNKHKKAMNNILFSVDYLLDWMADTKLTKKTLVKRVDAEKLQADYNMVATFNQFTNKGYGQFLLNRYPSLRKYFAEFIKLPFAAATGSEALLKAINIVRQLDNEELKKLPDTAKTDFVPTDIRHLLTNEKGEINRNVWETGLAIAIKNALRAGNLYIAQSKQHVSFWELILSQSNWTEIKEAAYEELQQPLVEEAKSELIEQFHKNVRIALDKFDDDDFATIINGKLKLKRDDKLAEDPKVKPLQKVIDANMPFIRIEELLMQVDKMTGFTQHFKPIAGHASKPKQFYKTLIAAIVSQATNLGVVAMSASMKNTSVDKLRHVLHYFIREDTLKMANAQIVNLHHQLPLSSVYGSGNISSSDAQRFGIRASSLLASYYPRYYGYFEKAIGIYTHVSDQYAVFYTQAISCGPREALYVLDGLLENNSILKMKAHTTDTHGFTEVIFALCHLLGYYFMPRIRDLKDQQLYKVDKETDYGVFSPLLTKTADVAIVEEQWDMMVRVASSLKKRTAPAHVIVERLMNSSPNDRLTTAFINLGRIIKTQYILRYITDPELRRTVQIQLNKGEYRHKLPRRVFFADQGEFTTGDYAAIMNKASCLSLVSNAVLYWNTLRINDLVLDLRSRGEVIEDETLSHISLLPYKHVIPNGSYFIDDFKNA
ncbi:MAG: Tn3 family transposase [Bacteroidota bacterium]